MLLNIPHISKLLLVNFDKGNNVLDDGIPEWSDGEELVGLELTKFNSTGHKFEVGSGVRLDNRRIMVLLNIFLDKTVDFVPASENILCKLKIEFKHVTETHKHDHWVPDSDPPLRISFALCQFFST